MPAADRQDKDGRGVHINQLFIPPLFIKCLVALGFFSCLVKSHIREKDSAIASPVSWVSGDSVRETFKAVVEHSILAPSHELASQDWRGKENGNTWALGEGPHSSHYLAGDPPSASTQREQ